VRPGLCRAVAAPARCGAATGACLSGDAGRIVRRAARRGGRRHRADRIRSLTASGERDPAATTDALGEMREAWDDFAERDAMFYIQSERTDWTLEEFFADGRCHFGA